MERYNRGNTTPGNISLQCFDCLLPLMHEKGVKLSPEEFHRTVNLVFHSFESAVYDSEHVCMWKSLPQQFNLLLSDCWEAVPGKSLHVLEVGCGTGLSAELFLKTPYNKRIAQLDLLDTSPEMLDKCAERARRWNVQCRFLEGQIYDVLDKVYDIVMCCSVLHHIPDLGAFMSKVQSLQDARGIFLHVHDPNGDFVADPGLKERTRQVELVARAHSASYQMLKLCRRVLARVGKRKASNYLDLVNTTLCDKGIIERPMSDEEIWSVTDIHDVGLPYSTGKGISIDGLREHLFKYELVAQRSYGFFGKLGSQLPYRFRAQEQQMICQKRLDGRFVAAAWQRA